MNDMALLDKDQLIDLVVQQQEQITMLEQRLRLLLRKQYCHSSEKIPAEQLALFSPESLPQLDDPADADMDKKTDLVTVTYQRKKRGKRVKCDENLERHRIEHTLSVEECQCNCGSQLSNIGETISEQYELIPARYIVIEHVQHKYACPCCKSGASIKLANKPRAVLPTTNAGPGLLAQIATAKFVDGVPLHRQEKQHQRGGIYIPRNTIARWLMQLSNVILSLINLFEDAIRAGPYSQCDKTPLQVLTEEGRKATSLSYIWIRTGGLPGQEVVLYSYFPRRSSKVALALFEDYQGYVQCDGCAACNVLEKQGIILIGCMAHAKRKFNDALKALPNKAAVQKTKAATALKFIKQLYAIEAKVRDESFDVRYKIRQQEAMPILEQFKAWLDKQVVLPKSPKGKAITYILNQWVKLIRYCDNGMFEIDNHRDERALRPLAIGRRNWLFCATPQGAHTNARFYSLIETCKFHGHEPYAYLKHIFKELPKASTIEQYEALLPWHLDVETIKQNALNI